MKQKSVLGLNSEDTKEPGPARTLASWEAQVEQALARAANDRSRSVLQKAISALDVVAAEAMRNEFEALPDGSPAKPVRPVNIPRQLAAAVPWALNLDLDRLEPLSMLAIGREFTHLLQCAKALGHRVEALCPSLPLNDRLLALYGISHHANQSLKDLADGAFDAIVLGSRTSSWNEERWQVFIPRIAKKLTERGRLFVMVAKRASPDSGQEPEAIFALFEKMGAQVFRGDSLVVLSRNQLAVPAVSAPEAATPAAVDTKTDRVEAKAVSVAPPKRSRLVGWITVAALIAGAAIALMIWRRAGL